MKFIVDCETNHGFVQFLGLTQTGNPYEYPFATQLRMSITILEEILDMCEKAQAHVKNITDNFHSEDSVLAEQSKQDFVGFTLTANMSAAHIVLTISRRYYFTLTVNSHVIVNNCPDLDRFATSCRKSIKGMRKTGE